jgi:hypothetical protein
LSLGLIIDIAFFHFIGLTQQFRRLSRTLSCPAS